MANIKEVNMIMLVNDSHIGSVKSDKRSVLKGLVSHHLAILMNQGSLERELNELLKTRWMLLNDDIKIQQKFISTFDQGNHHRMGIGEKPTWSPNEAYMSSLEWLWQPAEEQLNHYNLAIDASLRNLFQESREYLDDETEHRRIFYGQIVDAPTKFGITAFMLTVPHSHRCFCYPAPVTIQISNLLTL